MPCKPTIAIAGLAIETSTFSPARTHAAAFHPRRGDIEVLAYHAAVLDQPFSSSSSSPSSSSLREAANWRGALIGHALPGGQVTREAYEQLTTELLARLRDIDNNGDNNDDNSSHHLDGLWLDIHGAMCVSGLADAEAHLLSQIRALVGPHCLISASMDLHGNVSRSLVHMCDLITCYRTAPHVDVGETRRRACEGLLESLRRRKQSAGRLAYRPLKAWIPVPILLPGEQTSTRDEPAASIYAAVSSVVDEGQDAVLDAAVWVGYAWADEPRNRAAVVVTGWKEDVITAAAEKLARLFWERREEFHFVAPTGSFAECLDTALARIRGSHCDGDGDGDDARHKKKPTPFFISDSGDNPTAGGSGDVTWGLNRLLERSEFRDEADSNSPTVIYASVPAGPDAIAVAVIAGVGAAVTLTAGAMVDNLHAGPLTMTGRVHSIKHGDQDAVTEVVLQVGSVFAILTQLRKPYHKEKDFTELDLKPREADIIIVKIGYLEPELFAMAADWMLGLTPGGVDQDLERLGHKEIRRPMWPFDKNFERAPDLRARLIPMSNEVLQGPDE
ncbi:hypothetical protein BD289DRAFT_375550 [Coniella lustricola]|uniref:Microcystin LR degradation protein MlrC n=1 Tax=Coniella lustricola TaxID=2025994 RepID=A0A2T2ZY75_9PEZI|nr:hypothetical protein BD289DRAFT_375550 [Coniella lustricola]